MKKTIFEEILRDCVSFLPIILLILGYFVSIVRINNMPFDEVSIEVEEPVYEVQKLGEVPLSHLQNENPDGKRDVYREVPVLDKEGKPIKRKSLKNFNGQGKHTIKVEEKEITIPKMGTPPWYKTRKTEFEIEYTAFGNRLIPVAVWIDYKENVKNEGMGYFYKAKKVEFDIGINPKAGAVYGGAIGTAINLILIIVKYVRGLVRK